MDQWIRNRLSEKSTAAGIGMILTALVSMFVPPQWQFIANSVLGALGLGAVVTPTREDSGAP